MRTNLINRYLAAVIRKDIALNKLKRVRRKSTVRFWVGRWQREQRIIEYLIRKIAGV
jgi:hypothetical protein